MNKTKQIIRIDNSTKKKKRKETNTSTVIKAWIGAGALLLVLIIGIISYEAFHREPVVTIDGTDYYLSDVEIMYNVYQQEAQIESMSQMLISYGSTSYWAQQGVAESGRTTAMDMSIKQLLLYKEAEKAGKKITDEEKAEITKDVDLMMDNLGKARLRKTGFERESVIDYLCKVKVALNYYNELIEGYGVTEEDVKASVKEDDYKEKKIEYISANITETDKDNKTVDVSDEKKAEYKAQLEKYVTEAKAGKTFKDLVKSDDKVYSVSEKAYLATDTSLDEAVKKACEKLANGEYSEVVEIEGYLIVAKMVDTDSKDAYKKALEDAVAKEEEKKFTEQYAKLQETYNVSINTTEWEKIKFGEISINQGEELKELTARQAAEASALPEASAEPAASESPAASAEPIASPAA